MVKAVAVPYVIALILGIIVVAVIGYWFFVVAGGGGGQLSSTTCEAKFLAYCTNLAASNNLGSATSDDFLKTNAGCSSYTGGSDQYIGTASTTDCQRVIGQSTTTIAK